MKPRTAALVVIAMFLTMPSGAKAATPSQVLNDWSKDGVIDGDYSLAELRGADALINPQEREYYFWDDAYAEAVRRTRNPGSAPSQRPPSVVPRDFDGNGKIDVAEVAETKRRSAKAKTPNPTPTSNATDDDDREDPEPSGSTDTVQMVSARTLGLLVLIPGLVIGGGAWRLRRSRKRDVPKPPPPPSTK